MNNIIPYGKQYIDKSDILAVTKALKKDKITTGPYVKKFENKINKFTKSKYTIVCNSGTSALYLAFKSINLKKNDIVIMPCITFVSSYNIAKIFGAKVYLADVNPDNGQMSPKDIINCCEKFNLKKIKLIVPMYHGGYPLNASNFKTLKKKYGCYIIEDACHAFGATYKSNNKMYKIGSCKHADISTFSFHPLKTITTCEGGAVTTNLKKIYKKLENLRSIGISRSKQHWKYDVSEHSLNFRLSDIQCALGISQLNKINKFIKKREDIAKIYNKFLKNNKIELIKYDKNSKSAYHLYLLKLKNFNLKKKEVFFKFMKSKNIYIQYHYIPIYKFKVFKDKFIGLNAQYFYENTVSLPIYFELSEKKQRYVINSILSFLRK